MLHLEGTKLRKNIIHDQIDGYILLLSAGMVKCVHEPDFMEWLEVLCKAAVAAYKAADAVYKAAARGWGDPEEAAQRAGLAEFLKQVRMLPAPPLQQWLVTLKL